MTEDFSLTFCQVTVNIRSHLSDSLQQPLRALLQPAFTGTGPVPDPVLDIHLVDGARHRLSEKQTSALRRFPQLRHGEDGPTLTLLENRPDRRVVLRHQEPDAEDLYLHYVDGARTLVIGVESAANHYRGLARTLKLVLGSLVRARGAVVLHGACVSMGGEGYVLLGPRGSGKSSLAFVLTTEAGWEFISDDLVFLFLDQNGELRASGWPSRIGVATNLLCTAGVALGALRRYPSGTPALTESSWSAHLRRRIYLDADEFVAHFGVSCVSTTAPIGWVFPRAEQNRRGWEINGVRPSGDWLADNGATIRQLQHSTDHLGLFGELTADVTTATGHPGIADRLHRLPSVSLAYGPDINRDLGACWSQVVGQLSSNTPARLRDQLG